MRHLVLFLLILVPACAEQPRYADENVQIVWNQIDEPHKICEKLSGRPEFFQILGCSKWIEPAKQGAPRVCSIYAPRPHSERDMQRFATLGHEVMHCFEGNWHDRWGRMTPQEPRLAHKGGETTAAAGGSAALQEKSAAD